MRFRHLEYFVRAVECRSMNRAARQLDISPQALWAGVAALEKELGFALLQRSAAGVTPTHNGETVFREAVGMVENIKQWRALGEGTDEGGVSIKVGASTTLMRWLVPQVVVNVKKKAPNVRFDLFESFVEQVFRTALDQRMIGMITCVTDKVADGYRMQLAQNDMDYVVGPEDGCVVVLNREHPFAGLEQLTTGHLRELSLAWNPSRDKHFIYREISKFFAPTAIIYIPDQDNLLRLVSMERGIAAVLPRSGLAPGTWTDSIVGMTVEDFPMPGPIWLLHPRRLGPAERMVLDEFRQALANVKLTP